ncbi:JAB domain-containing protein [Novilysobacter arseniciresistens]|uniref:JAB domain-containing protein n=1 Tax=Novilysobacter arseniciresistens TaxID=1385522 RepID=UPI000692281C|nr:JAB domain-containing protein [Lysobacter arseniciresistens]
MSTNDLWTSYANADREDQIIAAAEAILKKRLERKGRIADPSEATRYLRAHCGGLEHEVFGVMFLDTRHNILAIEDLFRGTVDGAEVHPREVVKAALQHNAQALVLYHCHPSGNPEASAADRAVTARLKQALALVDIRILDHFIITGDECSSMAAKGWV